MASRFPSLRRINSTEPYRHRSLPAEPSPGSEGADSEVTFAVLYDDGPDYHVGHYDEAGSLRSGHQRDNSMGSFAPSFRSRDSRITSDEHLIDTNSDHIANQRLLAESYTHGGSYRDSSIPHYTSQSEDTLPLNLQQHTFPEKSRHTTMMSDADRSKQPHETWCTCDEEHGHSKDVKNPADFDVEAQPEPQTPTPFLSDKKPGAGGPGGPGGPQSNEFKVSDRNLLPDRI